MLQVRQLVKHFGGVHALDGVSFDVAPGECVALIGPNGAGKSTCFACLAGQHAPTSGEIVWAGRRIETLPPAARLRLGVSRTFQVAQTFEALTVRQNLQLLLGATRGLPAWNVLERSAVDAAMHLLARVGLQAQALLPVLSLPYGARKRLELAMALVPAGDGAQARLLLLDEPAAGLAPSERADLMRLVRSVARSDGDGPPMAVLYTEHNMDAVFGVADRVLVLIDGKLAAEGSPQEIARDPLVRSRYLGQAAPGGGRA
ncbi:MAG: ABC transporter ATP-binding protein [Burkholderiaceae bacterium]|nr:ABC transporter ATP-binding protein [Burkholderiaceae bacterium]MDO9089515.1 ABC transporter ATP-binding protein [Burkholderiaceae bacterium]